MYENLQNTNTMKNSPLELEIALQRKSNKSSGSNNLKRIY